MKFWVDLYDMLYEKFFVKRKIVSKGLLNFYLIVLFVAFFSLALPIIVASFSYCMYHTDDFGHALEVHLAWIHNQSVYGFLKAILAAANRAKQMYFGWGGNYTSFFFAALQPIAFSEKLNFVGTFVFFFAYLFSQYRFLDELLHKTWKIEKKVVLLIYFAITILGTQWLTSANEAFFWYAGAVPNTMGFSAGLEIIRIFLQTIRKKEISKRCYVWGILLAIFTGGCNYSSLMALFLILALITVNVWYKSDMPREARVKLLSISILLLGCGLTSIVAPGNAARQTFNDGTDAFHAIIMAIVAGKDRIVMLSDYKILLLLLLIAPFIWNSINAEKEYRLPVFLLFLSVGIFCAMLTPTMKSDMSVGPRRTRNLYWWTYLNLLVINFIYILGWCKHKLAMILPERNLKLSFKNELQFMGIMIVVVIFTLKIQDIKAMPSVITFFELKSGKYAEFDKMMRERNNLYYSDAEEIEVNHIEYFPYLIFDDDGDIYPNEVGETIASEYYEKKSITVVEK